MPSLHSRRDVLKTLAAAAAGSSLTPWLSGCWGETSKQFRMQSPWVNDAEFIGYFTAIQKKWFEEEGVALDYIPGGPEIIAENVLLSGRAEIALAPVETVAKLVQEQRAPLVIIGAQYQKSPAGIVSLAKKPIRNPADLIGKKLAVPAANLLSVEALLRINGIEKSKVEIVPYQYDPKPLISGEVDATFDFVTNVPFTIEQAGQKAASFLLFDYGFKVFNDVVVVTRDVLARRRAEIQAWFRASRRGWVENFQDPTLYPSLFMSSWYSKTGRTVENEIFFNRAQQPLIAHPDGVFTMTDAAIDENLRTLAEVGVTAPSSLFDKSILRSLERK